MNGSLESAEPSFSSIEEELKYWKRLAKERKEDLDEMEEDYADFTASSKVLEEEMELELQQKEKKLKEVTRAYSIFRTKAEETMERQRHNGAETLQHNEKLQERIKELTTENEELQKKKRQLEQENDDLERRDREASASLADLEERLDKAIEDDVWMQTQLEETQSRSDVIIQRLKEDIREHKSDLSVKHSLIQRLEKQVELLVEKLQEFGLTVKLDKVNFVQFTCSSSDGYQPPPASPRLDPTSPANLSSSSLYMSQQTQLLQTPQAPIKTKTEGEEEHLSSEPGNETENDSPNSRTENPPTIPKLPLQTLNDTENHVDQNRVLNEPDDGENIGEEGIIFSPISDEVQIEENNHTEDKLHLDKETNQNEAQTEDQNITEKHNQNHLIEETEPQQQEKQRKKATKLSDISIESNELTPSKPTHQKKSIAMTPPQQTESKAPARLYHSEPRRVSRNCEYFPTNNNSEHTPLGLVNEMLLLVKVFIFYFFALFLYIDILYIFLLLFNTFVYVNHDSNSLVSSSGFGDAAFLEQKSLPFSG